MLQQLRWLPLIIIFICSCTKDKKEEQPPPPVQHPPDRPHGTPVLNEPGFGPSTAPFKDPAWSLPEGISLTNNIHWFGYCDSDSNWTKKKNYIGMPNPMLEFFVVCMEFRNNTAQMVTLRLPPIITLQSKHMETQNGFILTYGHTVTIRPHSISRIFGNAYCLNHDRRAPFDRVDLTNEWTLGPDKLPAPVQEIVDIVTPKKIRYEQLLKPDGKTEDSSKIKKMWMVQEAIWQVTDSSGLTGAMRQQLKDLIL